MMYREFLEADIRVIALWPIRNGKCACGDPLCAMVGKHPLASNWQHSPLWSDDQLEVMEEMDQFETGYGVLADGLLVVDVDERNGGAASYEKLLDAIPQAAGAGLIVRTGSGGESKHLYFRMPEPAALVQSLPQYPGIDFKSTGYVVGPGSLHASGNRYEVLIGEPSEIERAPEGLIDLLKKPERHRANVSGNPVDYTLDDLRSMVEAIPNDESIGHETYIRVGMGLHQATGGLPEAFDIWLDWAQKSPRHGKHGRSRIENRWHSFGKCADPVTLGTLMHYAEEAGWVPPVTFTSDVHFEVPEDSPALDDKSVDLLRPPGFAGALTQWINGRQRHSREYLAVAAALMTISSVAGMRYIDPLDGITPNLFLFGVSGSATGKESVLKSYSELARVAGVAAATHGGFKSEQEIYRNLTRHQAALYAVDELGEQLAKIVNARTKGTAAYLEGIIGTLMSLYSKANSHAMVTGDLKEEIRQSLTREFASVQKRIDENDGTERDENRIESLKKQLDSIDSGIERPYLNIFGLTTPERFGGLMDYDMATNGFMGRCLIFREREDNPKAKKRGKVDRNPVPDSIAATLRNLYAPGHSEVFDRVECIGEPVEIPTTQQAESLLDEAEQAFYDMAEAAKHSTGLTAIPRRGYEQVAKVSMILAIPGGLRTPEHVRWAYALVKRDVDEKMKLANANSSSDKQDALASLVMSHVTSEHGETIGRLRNKCRSYRPEDVDKIVEALEASGYLRSEDHSAGRGKRTKKYFAIKG